MLRSLLLLIWKDNFFLTTPGFDIVDVLFKRQCTADNERTEHVLLHMRVFAMDTQIRLWTMHAFTATRTSVVNGSMLVKL